VSSHLTAEELNRLHSDKKQMANQVLVPPPDIKDRQINAPKLLMEQGPGLFRSLANNVRDVLYPEKFSPLRLTSRPVPVKGIWGAYDNTRQASAVSMTVHAAMIGVLILLSVMGAKVVQETKKNEVTEVIAPDVSVYMPMTTKKLPSMGGGGGGGDRDKIQAPKGKLPTRSMEQLAPPEVVVRNDHPKLEVEPTIVMPANVQIPNPNMPNIGDPRSNIAGPPSNGVGSGGGIGSGSGGGIGSGTGAGHGPGTGGGYGGGVFRVGGGVTAPRAVSTPDPEYSSSEYNINKLRFYQVKDVNLAQS